MHHDTYSAQCVDLIRTFEVPRPGFDVPQHFTAAIRQNDAGDEEVVFVGNPPIEVIDCIAEVRNLRAHALGVMDMQYPEFMARSYHREPLLGRDYFLRQRSQARAKRIEAETNFHQCSTEVRNAQTAEYMAEEALLRFDREIKRLDSARPSADSPALDETQQGCAGELAKELGCESSAQ